MLVLVVERATPGLHGELTRWLLEPHSGVFVGDVSAMVRELLWELVQEKIRGGAALLVYSTDSEQGYRIRTCGETKRSVLEFDGLQLIHVPKPKPNPSTGSAVAVGVEDDDQ